jgi:ribosomal protein S18 acetylase RimI-like enzyme
MMNAAQTDPATSVRRGVAGDAAALAELAARTFVDTFGHANDPADMANYLASAYGVRQQSAELEDPDVVTLLAFRGDRLVGYAQVRRRPPPACVVAERPIELRRFYIDRAEHGRGVARALMDEAHRAVRALGGQHVWLGVWERNARAIAFYRKRGFVRVGSHDFYVGSDRQTDDVYVAPVRDHDPDRGGSA